MAAEANNIILIVGLGNPTTKHVLNRHNIGFIIIDYFSDTHYFQPGLIQLSSTNPLGPIGPLTITLNNGIPIKYSIVGKKTVILLKPQSFMNNSGIPVAAAQSILQVPHERILLIHDDMDFPFGTIRLKTSTKHTKHNGVLSVLNHINNGFGRCRVGIGRPENGETEYDYVLNNFTSHESRDLCVISKRVTDIIECFIDNGIQQTMSKYNGLQ